MTRPARKPPTLATKVAVLERALKQIWGCDALEYDHVPGLWERQVNAAGTDYEPPQNDPAFIDVKPKAVHRTKTNGTKATTAGSDTHRRAHGRRMAKKNAAFVERMQEKQAAARAEKKPRTSWPSRAVPSRPMTRGARNG